MIEVSPWVVNTLSVLVLTAVLFYFLMDRPLVVATVATEKNRQHHRSPRPNKHQKTVTFPDNSDLEIRIDASDETDDFSDSLSLDSNATGSAEFSGRAARILQVLMQATQTLRAHSQYVKASERFAQCVTPHIRDRVDTLLTRNAESIDQLVLFLSQTDIAQALPPIVAGSNASSLQESTEDLLTKAMELWIATDIENESFKRLRREHERENNKAFSLIDLSGQPENFIYQVLISPISVTKSLHTYTRKVFQKRGVARTTITETSSRVKDLVRPRKTPPTTPAT